MRIAFVTQDDAARGYADLTVIGCQPPAGAEAPSFVEVTG